MMNTNLPSICHSHKWLVPYSTPQPSPDQTLHTRLPYLLDTLASGTYNTGRQQNILLRYIRGTSDLCLTFTADNSKRLVLGYADADWGGDLDTRRSTTGYIFKVYGVW